VELIFLISAISTPIQFIIPQDHSPEPFSATGNTVECYNEQCSHSDVPMVIVSDLVLSRYLPFSLLDDYFMRETHQNNILSPPFLHNNSGPFICSRHSHACLLQQSIADISWCGRYLLQN
jgi:hypothetical protein